MQNTGGTIGASGKKGASLFVVLLFLVLSPLLLIAGCGPETNATDAGNSADLPNLTLTFPDGYSVERSTGKIVSMGSSSALSAPAYVTGITLTITGEDIDPLVFDVPLDTGVVSGTLAPGEYTFSIVVTTNIGLTFTGSQTITLVSGSNAELDIILTVNAPPTITSITISNNAPLVGDTVTATCSATDDDDEAFTYAWSGAASGTGQSVSYTIPADGTYTFTCIVTDVRGGMATKSVTAIATTTVVQPPGVITYFTATAGNGQVNLLWDPYGTAPAGTSFNIYWATTPGVTVATGNQINVPDLSGCIGADCFYTHTGLTNGTAYYYVVTAVNATGESVESAEVNATPISGVLAAPTGVTATAGDTQATITWTAVTGATSYNLYWSLTPGVTVATGTQVVGVTSPYIHTGLTNGTAYYYVVTAVNASGESVESAEVNATPSAAVLISSLVFTDANLTTCVNNYAALNGWTFVSEMTTLDCSSNGIVSLVGIENLTALTWLSLYNNQIIDVTPLQNLTALNTLLLNINKIINLTPLQNLTALTGLFLDNNQIIDVTPLQNLTALTTWLGLNFNKIVDVTPLQNLTALNTLSLNSNQIIDVTPLQNLTALTQLSLNYNQIVNVTPLQNLTALTSLYLWSNQIGGLGVGNVHLLSVAPGGFITLSLNLGMSCTELTTLLGNYPGQVDLDGDLIPGGAGDIVNSSVTCTNP